ncbi:hypothetical protein F5Y17DRAFT_418832 [Xylariaceae sp. FL0594]|nr:hypothetical protein F5Y17DRAFT_418832 [Xylariaceae sp. FL0594]
MPQDPNLYGQRPAKKQKKEIPLPSSLSFASELSSLISAPSTTSALATTSTSTSISTSSGRPRPSKTKEDIFSSIKKTTTTKRKASSDPRDGERERDRDDGNKNKNKIKLKHVHNTEEEKQDFARARRKMEEKARLYAAMKRGDYVAKENEAGPLVDFDRKWAEQHPEDAEEDREDTSSGSDNESSDNEEEDYAGGSGGRGGGGREEMVEYTDEFGRTRTGTRAEVQQLARRAARSALGARELEAMSGRPAAPPPGSNLIYGDAIQTAAFRPEDATLDAMAELAARRDKTPTPPADAHFDGRAEIRTKGTGFYQFSAEEKERQREMEELENERRNTERVRRERELEKERRRKEIEDRRRRIAEKRAEKMADSFLLGLAGEMGMASTSAASSGGGGGGGGAATTTTTAERSEERGEEDSEGDKKERDRRTELDS